MTSIHIKYCCALLLVWAVSSSRADLVINEVLASNSTGLQDGYGEREDWIEIFNNSPGSVDLTGYSLTDESDFLTKWPFPAVVLPAGGYLVVIASGKDLTDPLGYLHTNFKLDRKGNYLALVQPGGTPHRRCIHPILSRTVHRHLLWPPELRWHPEFLRYANPGCR